MTLQHDNPTFGRRDRDGEVWARAPYNFVPLPSPVVAVDEGEIPGQAEYSHHTGWVECRLTTRSPLYTRAAMTPEFFRGPDAEKGFLELSTDDRRARAETFHIESVERPVIPGSSLRGMLRSLVEIVSYSKVKWVTDDQIFFRAVGDTTSLGCEYRGRMLELIGGADAPRVEAGYLCKAGHSYVIRPAQQIQGTQYFRVEEADAPAAIPGLQAMSQLKTRRDGSQYRAPNSAYRWLRKEVWFQPVAPAPHLHTSRTLHYGKVTNLTEQAPPNPNGWEKGWFIASGWIPADYPRLGKHLHWIVTPPVSNAAQDIEISDEDVLAYRDGGGISQAIEAKGFDVLSAASDSSTYPEGCPCFFVRWTDSRQQPHVAFGHTAMFRLPYEKTARDYVPHAVRDSSQTDLAEAIFGYAPEAGDVRHTSRAGRVFVTDATYHSHPEGQPLFLAPDWFHPKVLGSPKPTTFQHYLVQSSAAGHSPLSKKHLAHYGTDPTQTEIRGTKLYWHKQGEVTRERIEETDQQRIRTSPKQYTGIKPVAAQVVFTFRVYFDNLRDYELGALLWALTLPGEVGQTYCHKLGMGQPLGLGSVHMDEVTLSLTRRTAAKSDQAAEAGRYARLFNEADTAWHAAADLGDVGCFVTRFDTFMCAQLNQPTDPPSLTALPRIAMLLKMLECPGPDDDLTCYMQVGPRNEYKARPVLPDPLHIEQPARTPIEGLRVGDERDGLITGQGGPGYFVDVGATSEGLLRRQDAGGDQIERDDARLVRIKSVDLAQGRFVVSLAPSAPAGPAAAAGAGNAVPPAAGAQPELVAPPAPAPPPPDPIEERTGILINLDTSPNKWKGSVRDDATGQEYRFRLDVIVGQYPARKAQVRFQVQGNQVVKLWRA